MIQINEALFEETSHSPALADLVGFEAAKAVIDFCFIANPYYPTPPMVAELAAQLPHLIKAYPSSNPRVSAQHLATVLHVDADHLIIGNGATELITEICHDLVPSIGVPIPTFGEYLEKIATVRLRHYPLDPAENYQLRLDEYLDWLQQERLRAAVVINPHNPTGQLFSVAAMEAFLRRAASLDLIIVDESFIDFAADEVPSLLPVAAAYNNLVIVRSMSKHCGVPGLRLGYSYSGNTTLVQRMRAALPTWNINTVAEYYLSMLPRTDAAYHESRKRVIRDVQHLFQGLSQLNGITPYPTGANFVCFRVDNGLTARQLQRRLLVEHKMYVRDCSNKEGMDRYHIRVASQGQKNDSALIDALRAMLGAV
ncbi:MAG TPA: histidinol-phosphate transaminase [Caldilineaceae bacterium]|nr:histidinol-phosphate transaminase [Caldilineaceae bacterium]